jgi:hypothetical protein
VPNTLVITLRSIAMSMASSEFARTLRRRWSKVRQAQTSFDFFKEIRLRAARAQRHP